MDNLIGIDIGFGDVKIIATKLKDGDRHKTSFPTFIASAKASSFDLEGEESVPIVVNSHSYYVGEDARKSSNHYEMRYESWFKEDEYLALYLKALSLCRDGDVEVVTGLPVSEHGRWKDELKSRLTGNFAVNGSNYNVKKVMVMPQPFGAFYDYSLGLKGNLINPEAYKKNVGVIDIGNRTTDFILIDNGKY